MGLDAHCACGQDASEVEKCVGASRGIMEGVCLDDKDRDRLLESLLTPRQGLPMYMLPSLKARGKEAPSSSAEADASGQSRHNEVQGQFVSALVLALGAEVGFATLLQPSVGLPR